MKKKIAEDLTIGIVEEAGTKVLSILVMNDIRTTKSINFVDAEIKELYAFLKEHFEEVQS